MQLIEVQTDEPLTDSSKQKSKQKKKKTKTTKKPVQSSSSEDEDDELENKIVEVTVKRVTHAGRFQKRTNNKLVKGYSNTDLSAILGERLEEKVLILHISGFI